MEGPLNTNPLAGLPKSQAQHSEDEQQYLGFRVFLQSKNRCQLRFFESGPGCPLKIHLLLPRPGGFFTCPARCFLSRLPTCPPSRVLSQPIGFWAPPGITLVELLEYTFTGDSVYHRKFAISIILHYIKKKI